MKKGFLFQTILVLIVHVSCKKNDIYTDLEDDNLDENRFNSLSDSISTIEAYDNLYKTGMNKFLFIKIDISEIQLEYFQLLIEEFLISNGEKSAAYAADDKTLVFIVSKNCNLSISNLKSTFSRYITNAYYKDS